MRCLLYLFFIMITPTWALHYKADTYTPPSVTTKTIVIIVKKTKNTDKSFDNDEDTAHIMDKCDAVCINNGLKSISSRRMGPSHVECHCAH